MPSFTNVLITRTTSGFPLSIGTGLSLETIFDPVIPVYDKDREVPPKIKKEDFNLYIFNIKTLIRNIITAVPSNEQLLIKPKELYETLQEEIDYLTDLFISSSLNIAFYVNTYAKAFKDNTSSIRTAHTEKQIFIEKLFNSTIKSLQSNKRIQFFDDDVIYKRVQNALILSSYPWDLCSHSYYSKLDLLESHTGIIKSRKDWYTKYFPMEKEDMSFLPMHKKLLPIFGDHSLFKPKSVKIRREILLYLRTKRITPFTEKIELPKFG